MTKPELAKRRFRRDEMEYIYRLFLEGKDEGVRNTLTTAYKRGLALWFTDRRVGGYDRSSLAYAAWAAGVKNAKRGVQS